MAEAIEELEKVVSLSRNQSEALFSSSLARAYTLAEQHKKALEEYGEILGLRDGIKGDGDLISMSHYRMGVIFSGLGRNGEAIQSLETFLQLWEDADPGLPEVGDAKKRLAALKSL